MRLGIRSAAALLILSSLAAVARADGSGDDAIPGKFAVGIYGAGDQYDNGQPTARWLFAPGWALDATPRLAFSHSSASNETIDDGNYGLDLTLVKRVKDVHGLLLGVAGFTGYSFNTQFTAVSSGGLLPNPATNDAATKSYTLRAGFGPDLEYPIPLFPNLTLGAHVFLVYNFSQSWGFDQTTGKPNGPTITTHTVGWGGEALTIRYYF
jgi:hypothetical protein